MGQHSSVWRSTDGAASAASHNQGSGTAGKHGPSRNLDELGPTPDSPTGQVMDEVQGVADRVLDCHTVIWCAGVTPNPLIGALNEPTTKGRLNVDACLRVPAQPNVYAIGDAAAVPDLSKPAGEDGIALRSVRSPHSAPCARPPPPPPAT